MLIKKQLKGVLLVLLSTQSQCSENVFKSTLTSITSAAKSATPYVLTAGTSALATCSAASVFSLDPKKIIFGGLGLSALGRAYHAAQRFKPDIIKTMGTKLGLSLANQDFVAKLSPFTIAAGAGIALGGAYWWQHLRRFDTFVNACNSGNTEYVTRILQLTNGIHINNDAYIPLMRACRDGNTGIVQTLLNYGANVNLQNIYDNTTLIMVASEFNCIKIVELLLENDANVNAQDQSGWTALMHAAFNGNAKIVQMLLNNGANIDLSNNYGDTALALAINNGRQQIIELLVQAQTIPFSVIKWD